MRVSTFHAKTEASDSKDVLVDGETWVETNINGSDVDTLIPIRNL